MLGDELGERLHRARPRRKYNGGFLARGRGREQDEGGKLLQVIGTKATAKPIARPVILSGIERGQDNVRVTGGSKVPGHFFKPGHGG